MAAAVRGGRDVSSATLTVAGAPSGVRHARHFVEDFCVRVGVSEDVREATVLLVSELVTNALIHGRSEARLTVVAGPAVVRLEVSDDNSRHPHSVTVDQAALDGRGMAIVEAVASRWGVSDEPLGKTVWAVVGDEALGGAAPQRGA